MYLNEGEYLKCPKCGSRAFIATAHVSQDWEIGTYGEFIGCTNECSEVVHCPDESDLFDCSKCGYSAAGAKFITTEQDDTAMSSEYDSISNTECEENYLFGEVVFDITSHVGLYCNGREYNSRELYSCIFEWANEFQKMYPTPGFDYLLTVEDFARKKLEEFFSQ